MLEITHNSDHEPDVIQWLAALRGTDAGQHEAIARLRDLLLGAARFEVSRRRTTVSLVSDEDLDDLAIQAAEEALAAVLVSIDDFRGPSRFTTWACKFALLEAGVRMRRLAWRDRDVVSSGRWRTIGAEAEYPAMSAEQRELTAAIGECITRDLPPHQRRVVVALAIDGVPIDVLAERWATSRGALYQALHDGRHRIRARLAERGLPLDALPASAPSSTER
jgi:RNA polymerase sigma-70 factor (ECF subfamily)